MWNFHTGFEKILAILAMAILSVACSVTKEGKAGAAVEAAQKAEVNLEGMSVKAGALSLPWSTCTTPGLPGECAATVQADKYGIAGVVCGLDNRCHVVPSQDYCDIDGEAVYDCSAFYDLACYADTEAEDYRASTLGGNPCVEARCAMILPDPMNPASQGSTGIMNFPPRQSGDPGYPAPFTAGLGDCACQADFCSSDGSYNPTPSCTPGTPGVEVCGGGDEDCDGAANEAGAGGCTNFYMDADADGYGTGSASCLCAASGFYTATQAGDCNDANNLVKPGATEVCGGGDENCDGNTDPEGSSGCQIFHLDADGDTYGTSDTKCLCGVSGQYTADNADDCNDAEDAVYPGANELCNGIDDNCVAGVDEPNADDCTVFYTDIDGDTFGASTNECLCGPTGMFTASNASDCNDGLAGVNPSAIEVCGGGDEDCDGAANEAGADGCTNFFLDADADGYGTGSASCLCAASDFYTATQAGDCNDNNNLVKPSATEVCGGGDENCDGNVDEGGVCSSCSTAEQIDVLTTNNSELNAIVIPVDTTGALESEKVVDAWQCGASSTLFANAIGAEFAVRPRAASNYRIWVKFVPDKTVTPTGSYSLMRSQMPACGADLDTNADTVYETASNAICLQLATTQMGIDGTDNYDTLVTLDGRPTTSGLNPNGYLKGSLKIWATLK